MATWLVICLVTYPLEQHVNRVIRDPGLVSPPLRALVVDADESMATWLLEQTGVVNVVKLEPRRREAVS